MNLRPIAFACLLLAAACQQASAPAAEYRPGEAGTVDQALCLLGFTGIPLREVQTGHHLVEASINGRAGNFVVDTGANVTVVTEGQAERFGVAGTGARSLRGVLPTGVAGVAGRAQQVGIDSFEIAGIPIRQQRVVRADLGQLLGALGTVAGEPVSGVIGQDVLTEHRAIIDVARHVLYIIEADEDPSPIPAERCGPVESAAA